MDAAGGMRGVCPLIVQHGQMIPLDFHVMPFHRLRLIKDEVEDGRHFF